MPPTKWAFQRALAKPLNLAHRLGGGKEVCAAIQFLIFGADQSPQFFINERQQLIGDSGIALLSRRKDARDVAHALQSSAETSRDNSKWF
jgi:hypothetical protein